MVANQFLDGGGGHASDLIDFLHYGVLLRDIETQGRRKTEEPTFEQICRVDRTITNHEDKPLHEPSDERPVPCQNVFVLDVFLRVDRCPFIRAVIEGSRELEDVAHGDQIEKSVHGFDVDDMRREV